MYVYSIFISKFPAKCLAVVGAFCSVGCDVSCGGVGHGSSHPPTDCAFVRLINESRRSATATAAAPTFAQSTSDVRANVPAQTHIVLAMCVHTIPHTVARVHIRKIVLFIISPGCDVQQEQNCCSTQTPLHVGHDARLLVVVFMSSSSYYASTSVVVAAASDGIRNARNEKRARDRITLCVRTENASSRKIAIFLNRLRIIGWPRTTTLQSKNIRSIVLKPGQKTAAVCREPETIKRGAAEQSGTKQYGFVSLCCAAFRVGILAGNVSFVLIN